MSATGSAGGEGGTGLPGTPRVLVFATHNRGKLVELKALVADLPLRVLTLDDVGFTGEVDEDQPDFLGNARKKAQEIAEATGRLALADDSGLEVDALGGAPGVHSARWAGEPRSDERNIRKLLDALDGVPPPRRARFRSVLVLAAPARRGGVLAITEGACEGEIGTAPRGTGGFGYDPIFVVDGQAGRTMAELTLDEKNAVSHRAHAMRDMADRLRALLSLQPPF